LKRIAATVALLIFLAGGAGVAQSAPAPVHLGQVANSATAVGTCKCTVLQVSDIGLTNASYVLPYDGVITKSGFYVGEEVNVGDWVQLRTFAQSGSNHATVTGDGAQNFLSGLPAKTVDSFFERLPVVAGEVLGARLFINSGSINATPVEFNTTAAEDKVGGAPGNPAIGDSFEASVGVKLRANVEAVVEPDDDADGYGDVSQDLCPGSPIGAGACSGSLLGSDFQGNHSSSGGSSGYDALLVQKSIGGVSTAAPFDGVLVRWRMLSPPAGEYGIRVLGSESGSTFRTVAAGSTETVTGSSTLAGRVVSFNTRISIPQGGYVGLATPSHLQPTTIFPSPSSTLAKINDGPVGTEYHEWGAGLSQELAYDADVEPDADHDGYGDVTQDSCPSDASIHEGSCPLTPGSTGEAGGPSSGSTPKKLSAAPKITGFKATPKSFHAKARGGGAKLKLTLDQPASLAFAIEAKTACRKAHKAGRCQPGFRTLTAFRRKGLSAGHDTVALTGRYKHHGAVVPLAPGVYRVTAVPTGTTGIVGAKSRATFRILKP